MALTQFGKYKKKLYDDPEPLVLAERQNKLKQMADKKQAETKDSLTDYKSKVKPIPTLRDEQGNINQKYKASRGEGALAGLATGAEIGQSRSDPFFGIGASIGGLIAGIFKPSHASKQKYQEDVEETTRQNEDLYNQTNATLRLQAIKDEQERKEQDAQIKMQRASAYQSRVEMLNKASQSKDQATQVKLWRDQIQTTSGEDRKFAQQQLAKALGDDENFDENYGVGWEDESYGGMVFIRSKNGEIVKAQDENGKEISTITPSQQIDTLLKVQKLNPEERPTAEEAWKKADALLKSQGVDKQFKNPKTKASQYGALVMRLSSQILDADKRKVKAPSTEFVVDGIPYKLDLPIIGEFKDAKADSGKILEDTTPESQFMPPDNDKSYLNNKEATENFAKWFKEQKPEFIQSEYKAVTAEANSLRKLQGQRKLTDKELESLTRANSAIYLLENQMAKAGMNPTSPEAVLNKPTVKSKPKVGEIRKIRGGGRARFDGKGWVKIK